jgi:hypothetical protein
MGHHIQRRACDVPPATPDRVIQVAERQKLFAKNQGKNRISYLTVVMPGGEHQLSIRWWGEYRAPALDQRSSIAPQLGLRGGAPQSGPPGCVPRREPTRSNNGDPVCA